MKAQSSPGTGSWHNLRISFNYTFADSPALDLYPNGQPAACTSLNQEIKIGGQAAVNCFSNGTRKFSDFCSLFCQADDLMNAQLLADLKATGARIADKLNRALQSEDMLPDNKITVASDAANDCGFLRFGPTTLDTDLLIYVTVRPLRHLGTTLAFAAACQLDARSARPILSHMNVAPATLVGNKDLETVLLHELTHALGFSPQMLPYFRSSANRSATYKEHDPVAYPTGPVKGDGVVASANAPWGWATDYQLLGPGKVMKIITPKVLEVARAFFACPTLDGVELENGGGSATSTISHWEKRILYYEYMTATQNQQRGVFSAFTLALFHDMGFYKANMSMAEDMSWGKAAGCAWAEMDCHLWPSTDFCKAKPTGTAGAPLCGYDGTFTGACNRATFTEDVPVGYRHFPSPRDGGTDEYADRCAYVGQYVTEGTGSGDCLAVDNTPAKATNPGGVLTGADSRCLMTRVSPHGLAFPPLSPACHQIVCTSSSLPAATTVTAHVRIGASYYPCRDGYFFQLTYPPTYTKSFTPPTPGIPEIVSYSHAGVVNCPPNITSICSAASPLNARAGRPPVLTDVGVEWSTIASVAPETIAFGGGTVLTITGTGLARCTRVTVGGQPATNLTLLLPNGGGGFADATQMLLTAPKTNVAGFGGANADGTGAVNIEIWCASAQLCADSQAEVMSVVPFSMTTGMTGVATVSSTTTQKLCAMGRLVNAANYTAKPKPAAFDPKNEIQKFVGTTAGKIVGAIIGAIVLIAVLFALKTCLEDGGSGGEAKKKKARSALNSQQQQQQLQYPQQQGYRRMEYADEEL